MALYVWNPVFGSSFRCPNRYISMGTIVDGCHLLQEGIKTSNVYCHSPLLLGCLNRIICYSIPLDIRASTLVDSASSLIQKYSVSHR